MNKNKKTVVIAGKIRYTHLKCRKRQQATAPQAWRSALLRGRRPKEGKDKAR